MPSTILLTVLSLLASAHAFVVPVAPATSTVRCAAGEGEGAAKGQRGSHISAKGQQEGYREAGRAARQGCGARWPQGEIRLQEWPMRDVPGAAQWPRGRKDLPGCDGPGRRDAQAHDHSRQLEAPARIFFHTCAPPMFVEKVCENVRAGCGAHERGR